MPRLADSVASVVDLVEYDLTDCGSSEFEFYEVCAVDFEDAFRVLALGEGDRGAVAFRALSGWAVFRRLCSGMAAAPLVWCRVSAAGRRLA